MLKLSSNCTPQATTTTSPTKTDSQQGRTSEVKIMITSRFTTNTNNKKQRHCDQHQYYYTDCVNDDDSALLSLPGGDAKDSAYPLQQATKDSSSSSCYSSTMPMTQLLQTRPLQQSERRRVRFEPNVQVVTTTLASPTNDNDEHDDHDTTSNRWYTAQDYAKFKAHTEQQLRLVHSMEQAAAAGGSNDTKEPKKTDNNNPSSSSSNNPFFWTKCLQRIYKSFRQQQANNTNDTASSSLSSPSSASASSMLVLQSNRVRIDPRMVGLETHLAIANFGKDYSNRRQALLAEVQYWQQRQKQQEQRILRAEYNNKDKSIDGSDMSDTHTSDTESDNEYEYDDSSGVAMPNTEEMLCQASLRKSHASVLLAHYIARVNARGIPQTTTISMTHLRTSRRANITE